MVEKPSNPRKVLCCYLSFSRYRARRSFNYNVGRALDNNIFIQRSKFVKTNRNLLTFRKNMLFSIHAKLVLKVRMNCSGEVSGHCANLTRTSLMLSWQSIQ